VGRLHLSLAERHRARRDARDTEPRQRDGGARDVDDGIDRTHLVEVDLLERDAVDAGLGAAERLEDRECALANRRVQARAGDQAGDGGVAATVAVDAAAGVPGRVSVLRTRHAHVEMPRRQRPAPHATHHQGVVEGEAREVGLELLAREPGVEERCEEHVARDAGEAIQVQDARAGRRATGCARCPAGGATVRLALVAGARPAAARAARAG
jgi:hypothetical protein